MSTGTSTLTGPVTVPFTVAGTGPATVAAIGPAGVAIGEDTAAAAIAVVEVIEGAAVAIADRPGQYPSRVNSVT
jgi:hypothetical protein